MPGTSVLPNAWMIDAHIDMSRYDKIYALAANCGGAVTKKFSQGSDDKQKGVGYWYHQRMSAGKRWGGICKALSIYWIAYHALDKDFWDWLMKDGWGQTANVNAVADLHGAYKTAKIAQDLWTAQVLAKVGIIEQRSMHGNESIRSSGSLALKSGSGRTYLNGALMAKEIAPEFKGVGRYKQFSFNYAGGGHAVAAWVERDVAFFDPNYGEFWFETTAGFRKFFPHFWEQTYGPKYNGEWYANSYGRKI